MLGPAMFFGVAYTVFSEWMNTEVIMSWQYTETMLRVPPLGTGIAPLLQWIQGGTMKSPLFMLGLIANRRRFDWQAGR